MIDAGGRHVLPGVIDPHVQLYPQPDWAHYATETGSAALGGVTTIVKMHRDLEGYPEGEFQAEIDGAESRAHVDFAFHLAVMTDAQIAAIPDYAERVRPDLVQALHGVQGRGGHEDRHPGRRRRPAARRVRGDRGGGRPRARPL